MCGESEKGRVTVGVGGKGAEVEAKGVGGGGGGGGKQMSCCQVHSPAYFSRLLCMHAHPADAPDR